MFKELFKSANAKWVFLVIVVAFLVWVLMSYSKGKGLMKDNFDTALPANTQFNNIQYSHPEQQYTEPQQYQYTEQQYAEPEQHQPYTEPITQPIQNASSYNAQNVANPSDLLPVDQNSQWATLNPVNNSHPQIPDLLQAGNLIGLDTIGQTMKNANLQLRSDPFIAKQNVGPWNNSTYEADLGRVPLELGQGQP